MDDMALSARLRAGERPLMGELRQAAKAAGVDLELLKAPYRNGDMEAVAVVLEGPTPG